MAKIWMWTDKRRMMEEEGKEKENEKKNFCRLLFRMNERSLSESEHVHSTPFVQAGTTKSTSRKIVSSRSMSGKIVL